MSRDTSILLVQSNSKQLELDFHVHAGRQVQLHELVDGLCCQVANVHQAGVRPRLKVLPRVLIYMRRPQHTVYAPPATTSKN